MRIRICIFSLAQAIYTATCGKRCSGQLGPKMKHFGRKVGKACHSSHRTEHNIHNDTFWWQHVLWGCFSSEGIGKHVRSEKKVNEAKCKAFWEINLFEAAYESRGSPSSKSMTLNIQPELQQKCLIRSIFIC